MITLTVKTNQLVLETPSQTKAIDLNLTKLANLLAPNAQLPPTELAWETAIMIVEDAISPLRDELLEVDKLQVRGADELRILAFANDDNGALILAETLEKAFAVLAGYRSVQDLPPLPQVATVYAKLLLLREWVHHLNFGKILLS